MTPQCFADFTGDKAYPIKTVTAIDASGITGTADGTTKSVRVKNITDSSAITYDFSESGDIVDLTSAKATAGDTISVTAGDANFIVAKLYRHEKCTRLPD